MMVKHIIFHPNGTKEEVIREISELTEFATQISLEERLAALESAMLSMMGVNTDV